MMRVRSFFLRIVEAALRMISGSSATLWEGGSSERVLEWAKTKIFLWEGWGMRDGGEARVAMRVWC